LKRTTLELALLSVLLVSLIVGVEFVDVTKADSTPTPSVTRPPRMMGAGKIRIVADGTVEGTDKISRVDNVYSLSGDIEGNVESGFVLISIEKDGVVFDGAGKTIQGSGNGIAIAVYGRKDVIIKNTKIINFGTGIELRATDFETNSSASNNRILDNYLETKYWGINLNTNNGVVYGNKIVSKNSMYGVNFQSNNTIFVNNTFVDGGLIIFEPCVLNHFSGNTINSKPLVYLERQANQVIDGAAQVFLTDCSNMTIRNVEAPLNLRMIIELFGTSNTMITDCKGKISLRDSHSNTIFDNQFTEIGSAVSYDSSAVALLGSNNNTIADNSIAATGRYGITLAGSSYNEVHGNNISSTGQAGIKIESTVEFQSAPKFNYIYDNHVTCTENGISFRTGAKNNFIFKNAVTGCKNAIQLSSGHKNSFLGNNISGSTQYAVYLSASDDNSFYQNNFANNSKPAYENHEMYWWAFQNNTYYSENNTWDNGKEGNYWDDYTGSDINGDGIGETPYTVYENFTDRYPLTTPFETGSVTVDFAEWVPPFSPEQPPSIDELRMIVLSPENITYSTTNIPLNLIVSQPAFWLGYSLDFQTNATISENTTLTGLSQGTHSLTVYGNTTQGVTASSETIFFNVNAPEPFPVVPVAATTVVAAVTASAGLLVYFKKRKRKAALALTNSFVCTCPLSFFSCSSKRRSAAIFNRTSSISTCCNSALLQG